MGKKLTSTAISKLIVGTFRTELGERLLNHFRDVFIERAIYRDGESIEKAAYRQGQADLIRQIEQELSNGR